MTFNERERFIFHATTAMTLASTVKGGADYRGIITAAVEGRCRHLSKEEIKKLYKEFEEELLCSQSVFDDLLRQLEEKDGESLK